jgi:hypothetical protein
VAWISLMWFSQLLYLLNVVLPYHRTEPYAPGLKRLLGTGRGKGRGRGKCRSLWKLLCDDGEDDNDIDDDDEIHGAAQYQRRGSVSGNGSSATPSRASTPSLSGVRQRMSRASDGGGGGALPRDRSARALPAVPAL